jgi:hypothetical protein
VNARLVSLSNWPSTIFLSSPSGGKWNQTWSLKRSLLRGETGHLRSFPDYRFFGFTTSSLGTTSSHLVPISKHTFVCLDKVTYPQMEEQMERWMTGLQLLHVPPFISSHVCWVVSPVSPRHDNLEAEDGWKFVFSGLDWASASFFQWWLQKEWRLMAKETAELLMK